MEEKELLNQLKGLLEEKYEPILVVQLLRVPPQAELQAFAQKLVNDFGYKVLVLPADTDTRVELISVLKTDVKEVKELQNRVLSLLKELEDEYAEILKPVGSIVEEDGEN
jgi:hypothetical protein|tara:strand:+ start:5246 stop:5575 length:330 start_codon:yes stop_codon:yes gene_type:complete